jgi:hypothetical protein
MISLDIEALSLSTMKLQSIEKLLKTYFDYKGENNLLSWYRSFSITLDKTNEVEMMRLIFSKIIPLIPWEATP